MWRTMLIALVSAAIVGFLIGIFLFPFFHSEAAARLFGNLVGAGIGTFVGLWVLKSLPEKEFSDFKVVLVARNPEAGSDDT